MGFQQGLSGLNAASKNLDVIGNNVANSGTVGFKSSAIVFADVYANSLVGAGSGNVGIGVAVADVAQNFSQGNVTVSSNPLDLAINGAGFFQLSNAGSTAYSRNGQFHLDRDGFIVNSTGANLQGYQADATGNIVQSGAGNLRVSSGNINPLATTEATVVANLDSRAATLTAAGFDANDPTTYTSATSMTVFDSLGNPHAMTIYFVKTAANVWDVFGANDGTIVDGDTVTVGTQPLGQVGFTAGGIINAGTTDFPLAVPLTATTGATTPYNVTLDFDATTQFGTNFGVTELRQNGYTAGRLTGFSVSDTGIILGNYSNGQTRAQGQIVMANFTNPNGLQPIGNNFFSETAESGQPLVGTALTGNLGSLQAGAVEESNVDLTQELVNMITAQRVYQANAQTIKTQDQVLQTLVNLR
jgi:flagellar hook protein FlgE